MRHTKQLAIFLSTLILIFAGLARAVPAQDKQPPKGQAVIQYYWVPDPFWRSQWTKHRSIFWLPRATKAADDAS